MPTRFTNLFVALVAVFLATALPATANTTFGGGSSGGSIPDNLTVSGDPAVFPATPEDNDTHIVTDDGTPTGEVLELWKWDEDALPAGAWVGPLFNSVPCEDPMARTALLALRNGSSLQTECHYVITDYNRGTVGASEILLHAINANTLSMDAHVATGFDAVAWDGRYDIDTNRITELDDNLGNEVSGQELVDTFPWGNTSLQDNVIDEGASFTYTGGTFIDNRIETAANVRVTGGNVQRNSFRANSNTTVSAGDFLENEVQTDATVTTSTTGDVDNNVFGQNSTVTITGGNVDGTTVGSVSRLTVSGGTTRDNTIESRSDLRVNGGSVYENHIESNSLVNLVGGSSFYRNTVSNESSLTIGNHFAIESEFSRASVNTTGSGGQGFRYSRLQRATVNATNVPTFQLVSSDLSANSQISANSATRMVANYLVMNGYGRVLVSPSRQLDIQYTGIRDYAYVQVANGRMYVNYSTLSGVSYIQNNSTGTNRVDSVTVLSRSNVRFLGTSTGNRVYYSEVTSGSTIYTTGSARNCYFYYNEVTSSSQMYANNSVNCRIYYNTASGNSQLYSQNVTGTHYMYYNAMAGHGYIRFENAPGGRIYAVHVGGQGLLRFRPANGNGRIYYSSFDAYYYLYADAWTLTRSGLHGHGRRTYTVTNPPNGTFEQNF